MLAEIIIICLLKLNQDQLTECILALVPSFVDFLNFFWLHVHLNLLGPLLSCGSCCSFLKLVFIFTLACLSISLNCHCCCCCCCWCSCHFNFTITEKLPCPRDSAHAGICGLPSNVIYFHICSSRCCSGFRLKPSFCNSHQEAISWIKGANLILPCVSGHTSRVPNMWVGVDIGMHRITSLPMLVSHWFWKACQGFADWQSSHKQIK